jgi:cytochrome c biogenesis protein CcmG, thiol:disulfide interchange protein DsbE
MAERARGGGRRWLKYGEVALWVGLLAFVGHRAWPQVAAAFAIGAPGETVPSLTVTTLAGEEVSLESLRGQVVLVNFWATWCPPCRIEMPGFERVYRAHRDAGFTVVGVSLDRAGVEVVERFVAQRGLTFPVGLGGASATRDFGRLPGLPTSFLIDHEGRIRHRVTGLFAEPALAAAVRRLLAEAGADRAAGAAAGMPHAAEPNGG